MGEHGRALEGIEQIRTGIAECRANQHKFGEPHWLTLLAEAYGNAGDIEEALDVLQEALATMDKRAGVYGKRKHGV